MDTKDAQEMMKRIYLERDKERGLDRTILRTFQELGELSEAIQKELPDKDIANELADVFAWLCSIANIIDIDIGEALANKYRNTCSRCEESPCECENEP
ncbi:MAG: nucleotide pyrophosphohydrolase [Candidatus Lokiarchaeota archaeon]|nr:nucleotide pyrophosphohydrolase [Candidatus Lokiarchaeota archaeon]